ncbi:hypothetical protein ACFQY8_00900 [Alloscardovia venturai]|uniref:Uncharacterized protein n=1 Tax=Alloscardovia venturai TaxID=1769421 RepID=A0ABW2Y8C4_9BIFI
MNIHSLSGIVLIAIILVILAGIIPTKTVKSLKNASRHSQDKFSRSLHIVDGKADSPVRLGNQINTSAEYVTKVRAARKAAVQRRRILVSILICAIIAVAVCAWYFHFSYAYIVIPTVLLGIVLSLGVRQAEQARQWEKSLQTARARARTIGRQEQSGLSAVTQGINTDFLSSLAQESLTYERDERTPLTFAVDSIDTMEMRRIDESPIEEIDDEGDVYSREIVSTKQVATAVPPSYPVRIPPRDREMEREINAPSVKSPQNLSV